MSDQPKQEQPDGVGLLPCPFCGPGNSMVDPWFDDVSKRWAVGCGRCGSSSGRSVHAEGSKEAAIKSWNTRGLTPTRDAAEGAFPIGEDAPYWRTLRAALVLPVEEQYAIAKDLAANCGYELVGDAYTATPKPAPDAMRERDGTRLPDAYDDGFAAGRKHERNRQIAITVDRDWLGQMVRHAWVEWAKTQDAAKPSWLLPYNELSEADKEADRQIGEYLIAWAKKYVPAALSRQPPQSSSDRK